MIGKAFRVLVMAILLVASVGILAARVVMCADAQTREQAEAGGALENAAGEKFLDSEIAKIKNKSAELEKALADLKSYNAQLEAKCKDLYLKASDLEARLKNSKGLEKVVESLNRERLILKGINEQLREDIKKEKGAAISEKADLYQQLGTAYTQGSLYSLAIEAYNKALSINPRNAEVHYNLGLLYRHSKNNSHKAIYHLKKYLQFSPDASNRKEVEYIIKMLKE